MKLHPKLENLLKEKDFHELNLEDQLWVEQYFSEIEYKTIRFLFSEEKILKGEIPEPSPEISKELDLSFDQVHQKKLWYDYFNIVFSYKIPVWQTALLLIILAGLFFTKFPNTDPEIAKEYVYLRDTIYLKQPIAVEPPIVAPSVEKTLEKKKILASSHRQKEKNPSSDSLRNAEYLMISPQEILPVADIKPAQIKGRSAKEMSELMDVLVEVH